MFVQGKSRTIFIPSDTLIYGISRDGSKNFNVRTCEHMILGQLRIWARSTTYAALCAVFTCLLTTDQSGKCLKKKSTSYCSPTGEAVESKPVQLRPPSLATIENQLHWLIRRERCWKPWKCPSSTLRSSSSAGRLIQLLPPGDYYHLFELFSCYDGLHLYYHWPLQREIS